MKQACEYVVYLHIDIRTGFLRLLLRRFPVGGYSCPGLIPLQQVLPVFKSRRHVLVMQAAYEALVSSVSYGIGWQLPAFHL